MLKIKKTSQLQIRVSPAEKAEIFRQAQKAGMGISEWVLSRALPSQHGAFQELLRQLKTAPNPKYVFAEIHDLLNASTGGEFALMVAQSPQVFLPAYLGNYVAAMVECAAAQKGQRPPPWTKEIVPLEFPVFGSDLESLRLYLLTHSPPPFRRRNIFVDSSVGERV